LPIIHMKEKNILVGSSINRIAKAEYDGQQYTAYGEAGYYIPAGNINLTPLASLQYTRLHLDGYTETGADALNLKLINKTMTCWKWDLGLRFPQS